MPILSETDRRTGGFTLFEMLVTLVILAVATTLVGISLANRSADWTLDRAVEQSVDDLHRARVHARTRGEPVVIDILADGYRIDRLGVERHWADGVEADWRVVEAARSRRPAQIVLPPERLAVPRVELRLTNPAGTVRVDLEPLTGQVSHVAE